MKQTEAINVLKTIKEIYPKYDICKKKASILIQELLPMDYSLVLGRLAKHVATHPFPPTISEIAAYSEQRDDQINKLKKWRQEAEEVPPELREPFYQQMLELMRRTSDGSDEHTR